MAGVEGGASGCIAGDCGGAAGCDAGFTAGGTFTCPAVKAADAGVPVVRCDCAIPLWGRCKRNIVRFIDCNSEIILCRLHHLNNYVYYARCVPDPAVPNDKETMSG